MPFQASPIVLYYIIIYLSVQLKGFPSRNMKQHRAFYLTRSKLRGLHLYVHKTTRRNREKYLKGRISLQNHSLKGPIYPD